MRLRVGAALIAAFVAAIPMAPAASAIRGGHDAPAAYPFHGSLERPESPRPDGHVCGATLIAPRWMVTAGHCAAADGGALTGHPDDWKVRIGSVSASSGGEVIRVEKFIRHAVKDIALLKLKTPAKAEPIEIADSAPAPSTPARIMGWGMTCDRNAPECFPDHLREADTKVQPKDACAKSGIAADEICVGSRDGSVAATNMDSGGPALVRAGGEWVLAGTVSGANDSDQPVVYIDAPAHRSWLNNMMAEWTPSLDGAVGGFNDCSGSVVRTKTSAPEAPALLLTNGHCVVGERPAPGGAVVDRPAAAPLGIYNEQGKPQATAKTTKLVYATMTDTDVALYQLNKTYRQLTAEGVKIFALSDRVPAPGTSIGLISGGLRETSSCMVGSLVPELREGGYVQHQSIRYTEDCQAGHGASGAPLVDQETGKVVGIHATSNDAGQVCTANNPCEVDESGAVSVHIGQSYGQRTASIPACLTAGSEIDLALPGCDLPKPAA